MNRQQRRQMERRREASTTYTDAFVPMAGKQVKLPPFTALTAGGVEQVWRSMFPATRQVQIATINQNLEKRWPKNADH